MPQPIGRASLLALSAVLLLGLPLSAIAKSPPRYQLAVAVTGDGVVTSKPTGISCPPTCTALFRSATKVRLHAAPAAGSTLLRWGSFDCGVLPVCTLAILRKSHMSVSFRTTISVDLTHSVATVSSTALGVNATGLSTKLLDPATAALLKNAGVTALRWPGGTPSDDYSWKTQSFITGRYGNDSANNFDNIMHDVAGPTGAQAIVTVNYGSGDPTLAADWVTYAHNAGYPVAYWEIGNEIYGNGTYSAAYETDQHACKTPTCYGQNAAQFIDAMKARDPSAKVGVDLSAPGDFVSFGPSRGLPDWNSNVLMQVGSKIDFVILHWYPETQGRSSDTDLLEAPESNVATPSIASIMNTIRSEIKQYCGANAPNVQILVTETGPSGNAPNDQTTSIAGALFLADDYLQWLSNGVTSVEWSGLYSYNLFAGGGVTAHPGPFGYGLWGLASMGGADNGYSEPAPFTPYLPYYGLAMLHTLISPGDVLVATSSADSSVKAYGVKRRDGAAGVLLINDDPMQSHVVGVGFTGFSAGATATRYSLGIGSTSIAQDTTAIGGAITLPPYSLTSLLVPPAS